VLEAKHYQGTFFPTSTSVIFTDAKTDQMHHNFSVFSNFRHLVPIPLCALCVARAAVFPLQLSFASEIVVSEHVRWTVNIHDYAIGHSVYLVLGAFAKLRKSTINFIMSQSTFYYSN
jgi:hypothetical protein